MELRPLRHGERNDLERHTKMKVPLYQTCRSSKVRETKKSLSVQLEEFWLVCLAELEEVSISLRLGAGELELIRTLGFTTRITLSFH